MSQTCPPFVWLVTPAGKRVEVATGGSGVEIVHRGPALPRLRFSWEGT